MLKTKVERFLSYLKSLHPTITFTVELEVDGKLPFLDTLLHHKYNGSLEVSIHRNPTHTNCFLSFSSHHTHHVKEDMVSCSFLISIHLPWTVDAGERQRLTGDKSGVVYQVSCNCGSIYMGRDQEGS